MLVAATLIALLDSIAAGVDVAEAAFGVVGDEAGTIAKAATENRNTLAAIDDADVQTELTPIFALRARLVKAASIYPALQGAMINRALDVHYGGTTGSLNAELLANDKRVHPNLKLIGFQIDARNVFLPTVLNPVAQYNGTGAGSGNVVIGFNIDESSYGPASMEVVVDAMGAAQRTLTLTMTKWGGTTENKDVVVPGGSIAGSTVAIGGANDRYVGVSQITSVGGLNGDQLRVRSKVERVIAL